MLAALFGVGNGPASSSDGSGSHLERVSGVVSVVKPGGSALQPAPPGTVLEDGDRVATVGKSSATVRFASAASMELGAESAAILQRLDAEIHVQVIAGATVHRVPSGGYRVSAPDGDPAISVEIAGHDIVLGFSRDQTGNVVVACERCAPGAISSSTHGGPLSTGQARAYTSRGDQIDFSLAGSLWNTLYANPDENVDGLIPAGQRLAAPTRTPGKDRDGPSANRAILRILAPKSGQVLQGPSVQVIWEAEGVEIIAAAQARRREERHAHVLLDRDAQLYLGTNRPIPFDDPFIVHTASRTVTFAEVSPGVHHVDLILAFADHISVAPPVADSVTFSVIAPTGTASPTPTPTRTPTATPALPPLEATIANFVYLPDPILVSVGRAVRWTNLDDDIHTVTAEDLSWTSPVLAKNQTFSRTFTQPGTYRYFCEPHPFMRAEVQVQ